MDIIIRAYKPSDYTSVALLYKDSSTHGWQYDDARDSETKLNTFAQKNPKKLLVAEVNGSLVGSVTIFEDGRTAWLYRFAVHKTYESIVSQLLYKKACAIVKRFGHSQLLVYAPKDAGIFIERYTQLGFTQWNDFTAYWQDL